MSEYVRPSWDQYFCTMALVVASRGTCVRRRVGCILVDRYHHIIGTGYNGRAAGMVHCLDAPCAGAESPTGTNLEQCEAIHAEQNALLQCRNVMDIDTVYTTTAPCVTCINLLLSTPARRIVFIEDYPHSAESYRRWTQQGQREWVHVK